MSHNRPPRQPVFPFAARPTWPSDPPPAAEPTEGAAIEQGPPPCLRCGNLDTVVAPGGRSPDMTLCPKCGAERFLPRPPSGRSRRS